jgi:hypothetical protein
MQALSFLKLTVNNAKKNWAITISEEFCVYCLICRQLKLACLFQFSTNSSLGAE